MFAFIQNIGGYGIVILAVLALILFGTRGQIPAFMRDIGRGINSFRTGLKEGGEDAKAVEETDGETVEVETEAKETDKA